MKMKWNIKGTLKNGKKSGGLPAWKKEEGRQRKRGQEKTLEGRGKRNQQLKGQEHYENNYVHYMVFRIMLHAEGG